MCGEERQAFLGRGVDEQIMPLEASVAGLRGPWKSMVDVCTCEVLQAWRLSCTGLPRMNETRAQGDVDACVFGQMGVSGPGSLEEKNAASDVLKGGHICRQALFSSWYVVLFLVFQRTLITQGILS